MKLSRKTLLSAASGAAACVAAGCSPAFAQAGQTTWTTYLYQGPGPHYMVIGEVPQSTDVDVIACKDGWCDVGFEGKRGFVMSEVVATGDPSKPAPGLLPQPAATPMVQPAGPCFEVNEKGGNGGNALTYVCNK